MQNKGEFKYLLAVLSAGTLWGFMGLFRRVLGSAGVDSAGVILLRCGSAALLFLLTILLREPSAFRIKLKDAWCFFGTGICSMLFFTFCYFQAMNELSLAVAAILLYTAPLFVSLMSAVLFHEPITKRKCIALMAGFAGCCFVSGIGGIADVSVVGFLYGIGAGFGYALYSIFAKFALERGYSNQTINLYTHSLAAFGAAFLWGVNQPLSIAFSSGGMMLFTLALGFFTCYLPYLLYTYSLTGLEAGKASVYANIEPVVATLVGVLIFHEDFLFYHFIGIALVLIAVILLGKEPAHKKSVSQ